MRMWVGGQQGVNRTHSVWMDHSCAELRSVVFAPEAVRFVVKVGLWARAALAGSERAECLEASGRSEVGLSLVPHLA